MIQIIAGDRGSGKTKRLIDMANEALKNESGIVAFIDDDKRYMYDLRHPIRFVDVSGYPAVKGCTTDMFFGFLCGMLSVNYDLTLVCIDSFIKLVKKTPLPDMEPFFEHLKTLSENSHCAFIINIGTDNTDLPAFIAKYVI